MPNAPHRPIEALLRTPSHSSRFGSAGPGIVLASLLGITFACDGPDPEMMDDEAGSAASFGPLPGEDDPDSDEGSELPEVCSPGTAPSVNDRGILSHYPSHIWELGSSDIVPVSANYEVNDIYLEMWVEIRNDGPMACFLIPEASIAGTEVFGIITLDPHDGGSSDVTASCIGPGGHGVFNGIAEGVTRADLEASPIISFDPGPFFADGYFPAAEPALVDPSVDMLDDGRYGYTATLVPARDIYNHGLTVFPKDAHGLVIAELLDFPNGLDLLPAGSEWPIETRGLECPFDDYLTFQSWIEGSAMGVAPETDDSHAEHQRFVRQQRVRMEEIAGRGSARRRGDRR